MDAKIIATATASVPINQPGGTYKEDGYTVIPVSIQEVIFKGVAGNCTEIHIKSLQEILVPGNLDVPRGSKLRLEFDINSLGGVTHWPEEKSKGIVIRAAPYAVEIRYERKD